MQTLQPGEQRCLRQRLLNIGHVDMNGKPMLYLVFEYVGTNLKRLVDVYRKGTNPRPLPSIVIQMPKTSLNPSITLLPPPKMVDWQLMNGLEYSDVMVYMHLVIVVQ